MIRLLLPSLAIGLLFASVAGAQQAPAYLAEFPPPARVLADTRGANAGDTLALQVATFNRLSRMVQEMADRWTSQTLTDEEKALMRGYGDEAARLQAEAVAGFDPAQTGESSPRAKWFFASGRYERDPATVSRLLQRYFSPGFQQQYRQTVAGSDARLWEFQRDQRIALAGGKATTWDGMTRSEQESAQAFAVAVGFVLVLLLLRELLPFGVTGRSPPTLRAGYVGYRLKPLTGTVRDYRAWTESRWTVTERRNPYGGIESRSESVTTTSHETFSLDHADGTENAHFVNEKVGAAEGDRLTLVGGKRRLRRKTFWLAGVNHTQGERATALESTALSLLAMSMLFFPVVMALGFFLGSTTDLLTFIAPRGSPTLRGLLGLFIAPIAWLVVSAVVAKLRVRRFRKRGVPVIAAWVGKEVPGATPG